MLNFLLIVICLLLGIALQKMKSFPENGHTTLNFLVLYVALPAMTILNVPLIEWKIELLGLCLVSWLTFFLAHIFFNFLGKKFNWHKQIIGCLILTAGLGNTSFVGFPVVEFMLGQSGIRYAIIVDQCGTFLVCSTLGIYVAHKYTHQSLKHGEIVKRVLKFPPFLSFFFALILAFFGFKASGTTALVLEKFSQLLAPLALISVGLQLKFHDIKSFKNILSIGLLFKLIITPCVIYLVYKFFPLPIEVFKVIVVESAMAPMLTASIVAINAGLEPRLASLMVGVGVPLSLLTLGLLYYGLNFL